MTNLLRKRAYTVPVTGFPPVLVGGNHDRLQELGVYPKISGWLGASGGSNGLFATTGFPSNGSDTPYMFSALTRKMYFLPSVKDFTTKLLLGQNPGT